MMLQVVFAAGKTKKCRLWHRFKKHMAAAEEMQGFKGDMNQLIVLQIYLLCNNDESVRCGCIDIE